MFSKVLFSLNNLWLCFFWLSPLCLVQDFTHRISHTLFLPRLCLSEAVWSFTMCVSAAQTHFMVRNLRPLVWVTNEAAHGRSLWETQLYLSVAGGPVKIPMPRFHLWRIWFMGLGWGPITWFSYLLLQNKILTDFMFKTTTILLTHDLRSRNLGRVQQFVVRSTRGDAFSWELSGNANVSGGFGIPSTWSLSPAGLSDFLQSSWLQRVGTPNI